jgi:hypothetical protein
MSIFGTILSKIFPGSHPAVASATAPPAAPAAPGATTSTPGASVGGTAGSSASAPTGQPTAQSGSNAAPASQTSQVDVEAILEEKAKSAGEKLNWRTSIVDLMKLLGLDSSLTARKELAQELHYSGDMNDSAQMNMWLQKQVMKKLAENGGKVPADLLN